jgi:hypothetical protein
VIQAEEGTFFTVLFGYLLAAHFLGDKLSVKQLLIFNGMYLATILGLVFNMWGGWNDMYKWFAMARDAPTATVQPHIVGAMLIYVSLVLASLYFMWTVRHSKP